MIPMDVSKLKIVKCCATCRFRAGWINNMWCSNIKDGDNYVVCYNVCDDYAMRDDANVVGVVFPMVGDE